MCSEATVVEGMKSCCYQNNDKNDAQKPAAMDSCFGLVRHGTASKCIYTASFACQRIVIEMLCICLASFACQPRYCALWFWVPSIIDTRLGR